jgi:hypothetical protein
MDVNKLLQALEDESNENLLSFTTEKLIEMNFKIIKELHLTREESLQIMKMLKGYKYVDEMDGLKKGTYIRWIPIKDPTHIEMKKGAIYCETKIGDDGVYLVCKGMGFYGKHFRIKMDECLIFQKLTDQEMVLISALDHLAK